VARGVRPDGRKLRHRPLTTASFQASVKLSRSSSFGLIEAFTSPVRQSNSPSLIANDDVSFGGVITSYWSSSQLGRSLDLHPGDGVRSAIAISVELPSLRLAATSRSVSHDRLSSLSCPTLKTSLSVAFRRRALHCGCSCTISTLLDVKVS
jgi:hypothetical protein